MENIKRHIPSAFVTKALMEIILLYDASKCLHCEKQLVLCQVHGSVKRSSFLDREPDF